MTSLRWPFTEDGEWDGRTTFRWTSPGISIEQATLLTNLKGWVWSVRELRDSGYQFTLTRRSAEPVEIVPKRRRSRWAKK